MRSKLSVICAVFLGSGCQTPSNDQTSSHESTSAVSNSATTSSGGGTSTSGTTATPTEGTSTPTMCGDGNVQEGEICDDGNAVNGDDCNIDCQPSSALVWEYKSVAEGADGIYDLAIDASGSIFIGGFRGNEKIKWLAKFPASGGEPLWSEQYDQGDDEAIRGIALSPTGLYAVGGTSTASDSYDVWIAGLSGEGKIVWEDTFSSGFGPDYATAVTSLTGGDVVVAGLLTPENQLGGALWVRRYAVDGVVKWTETLPDLAKPLWANGPGISANDSGIVVGYSQRISAEVQPELLVGFGHDGGSPLWMVNFADPMGLVYGLAHAPNGELVIASRRNSLEFIVRRTSATVDDVLWESNLCMGSSGRAIAIDKQGDVVALGDGPGAVGTDIRLCKFTFEGELRWSKSVDGGFGDDRGYALGLTEQDHIVVGGWTGTTDAKADAWLAMYTP